MALKSPAQTAQTFFFIFDFSKIRQIEWRYALCSSKVNKVSRIFSLIFTSECKQSEWTNFKM